MGTHSPQIWNVKFELRSNYFFFFLLNMLGMIPVTSVNFHLLQIGTPDRYIASIFLRDMFYLIASIVSSRSSVMSYFRFGLFHNTRSHFSCLCSLFGCFHVCSAFTTIYKTAAAWIWLANHSRTLWFNVLDKIIKEI